MTFKTNSLRGKARRNRERRNMMGNGSMVVVIGICVYAVFILGLGLLKKTDGKNFVNVGGGIGSFALVCSMFISIILVVFIVPYAALQMVAIGNGIALGTKGIISFELAVVTLFTFFVTPPLGLSAVVWGILVNLVLYIAVSLMTNVPWKIVDTYITPVEKRCSAGE